MKDLTESDMMITFSCSLVKVWDNTDRCPGKIRDDYLCDVFVAGLCQS